MILKYKYLTEESNANLFKHVHNDTYFTNHVKCKIYDEQNNHVGNKISLIHYTKIGNKNFAKSTSTIRLFNKGKLVNHLTFETTENFTPIVHKIHPHHKTGFFENKHVVVYAGPKDVNDLNGERILHIHVK